MRITKGKATVSQGEYSESFSFAANPLNHDIILGKMAYQTQRKHRLWNKQSTNHASS